MDKSKYQWGTILQSTKEAKGQLDIPVGTFAICLGSFGTDYIRVLAKNKRRPETYHFIFWRPTKRKIRF